MPGYFKIASKKKLSDLSIGDKIDESDFATFDSTTGEFVQLEYIETEVTTKTEVKPGLYSVKKSMMGLYLESTEFVQDKILEDFTNTQEIEENIDCFFNNLQAYYEHGIEVPKHSILLWGPPGSGKTTVIHKSSRKYINKGNYAVIVWDTNKLEAFEIKDFIKNFDYKGVDCLILVAEDIGGIETDTNRMNTDSSLLSLLDNKEKTFTIPVLILSTTNYPESLMETLTNRPERFDDKVMVGFPDGETRVKLLNFFTKVEVDKAALTYLQSKSCEYFTPAHIRQIVMRNATRKKDHLTVMKGIVQDISKSKKAFKQFEKKIGIE